MWNILYLILIAHSAQLKECYDSIEILLNAIHYSDYQWSLCWDLKVIGIFMGLRGFQNIVVFYVCGTVAPLHSTMKQKNGRQGIHMHLE